MKKPKILILIMSANQEFFNNQINDVKNTWIDLLYKENTKSIIDKYSEEIDWVYYDNDESQSLKINYTEDNKPFLGKTPDVLPDKNDKHHLITTYFSDRLTWHKTYSILNYLFKENKEIYNKYDYIIRTNTSTYVNLPFLIYTLYRDFNTPQINGVKNYELTYGVEFFSSMLSKVPKQFDVYARGNLIVLTRHTIQNILLKYGQLLQSTMGDGEETCTLIDDIMIGNLINCYHNNFTESSYDYLKYYRALPFNWYQSVQIGYTVNHKSSNNGLYSNWNSDKENYTYNIGVQIKNYIDRSKESKHYKEFHHKMCEEVYPLYTENFLENLYIKLNIYSNNPSVFICGNIPYLSFKDVSIIIQDKIGLEKFKTFMINNLPSDVWMFKHVLNFTEKYLKESTQKSTQKSS